MPQMFFKKLPENPVTTDFIYLISSDFVTISYKNYWEQVNSWKILWKFWNGLLCRNKLGPFPLLNVAANWQSSNTKACAKKLSQILVNNIDHEGRGFGLRIYVMYCSYTTRWCIISTSPDWRCNDCTIYLVPYLAIMYDFMVHNTQYWDCMIFLQLFTNFLRLFSNSKVLAFIAPTFLSFLQLNNLCFALLLSCTSFAFGFGTAH